jgi:hypothetical protein
VKASVGGRPFEGGSWAEVLAAVLMAVGTHRPSREERLAAVNQLKKGRTVVIGGVLVKPEGARE